MKRVCASGVCAPPQHRAPRGAMARDTTDCQPHARQRDADWKLGSEEDEGVENWSRNNGGRQVRGMLFQAPGMSQQFFPTSGSNLSVWKEHAVKNSLAAWNIIISQLGGTENSPDPEACSFLWGGLAHPIHTRGLLPPSDPQSPKFILITVFMASW